MSDLMCLIYMQVLGRYKPVTGGGGVGRVCQVTCGTAGDVGGRGERRISLSLVSSPVRSVEC